MSRIYSEDDVMELTGYCKQSLYNLRKGRSVGKYKYKPKLDEGEDWYKFGGSVAYTEKGRKRILEKSNKRGKQL